MFGFFKKASPAESATTAFGFSFQQIDGRPLPLADYRGKALLIVNTASRCGFTPQYEGLETLYKTYRDRGLEVLGVPCNDFGGQEPGSVEEIKDFCETRYSITFPLTQKTSVSGRDAHPFYIWAAAQKKGGLIFSKPRWNFHKYLLAPDGTLAGSFGSQVKPLSEDLSTAIEAILSDGGSR